MSTADDEGNPFRSTITTMRPTASSIWSADASPTWRDPARSPSRTHDRQIPTAAAQRTDQGVDRFAAERDDPRVNSCHRPRRCRGSWPPSSRSIRTRISPFTVGETFIFSTWLTTVLADDHRHADVHLRGRSTEPWRPQLRRNPARWVTVAVQDDRRGEPSDWRWGSSG